MDLEALRSLLAFVETGSFTRAALQVHRSQSAVSMQMKKLEADVGQRLFVKQGRDLTLTQAGLALARQAHALVQLHDRTLKELKSNQHNTVLRLGCPDDYAQTILPKLVGLLREHINPLDLQISCASSTVIRHQLDCGQLDAAILTRAPDSEEGHFLHCSQGAWFAHPHFKIDSKQPLPIAVFQRDCKFHQTSIEGLIKLNQPFEVIAHCGSAVALNGLVAQGLAIGAMAQISNMQQLVAISAPYLPILPAITIVLATNQFSHNPMTPQLAQQLSAAFQHTE
ncbi:LysR family transcriptional regulator [Pseudoalteromonas ulvae]|uniref:LysR family transcriptional regulator n=1 Tax=Pseudoalteromonas ulvae TaxID=107327 RepID=A0A244CSB1_PSEDV|nr:LysR family transcriptional regulator [Pseudoalteromonas ulvae]OUL58507.1 LysR family transcriptional regulator [Pseudoalteromonas ulvae]